MVTEHTSGSDVSGSVGVGDGVGLVDGVFGSLDVGDGVFLLVGLTVVEGVDGSIETEK